MAALVTVLFVVSGLVALAYEVVWVRALGLVVGNSLWAAVAVVAAYMGGMAAGSALVARLLPRLRHHLRWYAVAEALAALFALATPAAMAGLADLAAHLGAEPLAGWGLPLLGRFGLAWLFLAVPTVAMGATLPLLVARVGGSATLVRRVGRLYSANTFGAVAGVLLAAFAGLPWLGERATLSAAALIGLVVAGLAWLSEAHLPPVERVPAASSPPVSRRAWLLWPALFGFVALALELVWTRVLLLHLGTRVYAFALILAIYLLGIALGAAAARGATRPRAALARWQLAASVAVLAQIPVLARFADLLESLARGLGTSGFALTQLTLGCGVALLLLPPTMAFGASFPLAVAAWPGEGEAGPRTGLVAAANTAGAIMGTVAAPLVLVPLAGSQRVLLGLAATCAVAAAALAAGRGGRAAGAAVAAAAAAAAAGLPDGLVLRGADAVSGGELETLSESASATVVVRRHRDARGEWRSLELNGVNVAGTSVELRAIQRLQGHLPLLLHPAPRRVLHIGFGSGGTAYAVSRHAVERIDIAEISPEVLAVSDRVFGDVNFGVLRDPRVRVLLNDGRNVLLASSQQWDAILSDSIHPVFAGNSTLYTREYFQMCRDHLTPDGVVSMWLPMYSLSEASFLGILRAFWEVFPGTAVWYDPITLNEFTVVTGATHGGPLQVRWERLDDPRLQPTLAEAGARSPTALAAMLLLGPREVAALVEEVVPHVDDFPEVEYRSGRLYNRERTWLDNFRILWAARAHTDPFELPPGVWSAAAAARDEAVRAQLRQLSSRIQGRPQTPR
ncbi:MAG TPA: fused MFS/spermidine synthase [Thermoanaerobaculaceae bacterium]|nr:fused MFS/spermidine synthase [Thermoanaerobaculaceae bacterium]HRS15538.1 fused MFS/spermidine synthase [Thermoanaerobaculaceae bacterium]